MDKNGDEPRMKILVVDDDQAVRQLVAAFLQRENYEPILAHDGEECLDMLAEHPDVVLVILDWMMPVMSGIAVLEELREQVNPPPVLMLSAKTQREDILEALQAGAVDYLLKPLQRDNLLFKVNSILEKDRDQARKRAARRKPVSLESWTVFTIVDISETGLCLESTFPLEAGSLIFLESEELSIKLDLPREHRYSVRVMKSEGKANKFRLGCTFAGLTPELQQTIRRVSQSGGWTR